MINSYITQVYFEIIKKSQPSGYVFESEYNTGSSIYDSEYHCKDDTNTLYSLNSDIQEDNESYYSLSDFDEYEFEIKETSNDQILDYYYNLDDIIENFVKDMRNLNIVITKEAYNDDNICDFQKN